MRIISKTGGASISVNPRGNGGLSICQGPHHVLLTKDEWLAVSKAVTELLREPSVA
jgi:hypothetical protein